MVKCIKCGVDIPDSAGYCPSCGAPKPVQNQVQQPVYRSMKALNLYSAISPLEGIFNLLFSKTAIL